MIETACFALRDVYIGGMLKAVRHDALLVLLQARAHASIQEVIDALGVSAATARRDIAELEERGQLERTWGGIRLPSSEDDPFQEALAREGSEKQRIAQTAVGMIEDGATVVLDIGTSVHYLALALAEREVTVLTASLPAFEFLRSHPNIDLVLLGGRWSEKYQCFDGRQVINALATYQADYAFLGCSGVAESGKVRDTSQTQAAIKRAIVENASRSYLLADTTKFPGKGPFAAGSLANLTGLITDSTSLSEPLAALCHDNSTEVHFV